MTLRRVALIFFVAVGVLSGFVYHQWRRYLTTPIATLTAVTVYEVPPGTGLNSVLRDLNKRGLIRHPRELSLWLRVMYPKWRLKAGEYELRPGLTPLGMIELFDSGQVRLHSVTIVEGATFADFERTLAANSAVVMSSPRLTATQLMRHLQAEHVHPEGQFFPDTYRFPKGTTDLQIYTLAYRRMQDELAAAWRDRDPSLPLAHPYEALILASIVEKETALASERAQIAGVFVERLRKGMRLQTDPTVIYGLGAAYDGNIRRADLERDTPYNTYTRAGLPPTPICLPGLGSLRAAVRPERTGALYFVATGKGDGSHYFSKTLEEHNAAVRRYLRALRIRPND